MRLVPEWHYLVRVHYKSKIDNEIRAFWRIYCFKCIDTIKDRFAGGIRASGPDDWVELISYSALDCDRCLMVHVTPQGLRPPFKMRTVIYQIVASYPEYDLTA